MKLKVAIIGAGRIGTLHAGNVARHPRMEIVAVHDTDRARAVTLAQQHGVRALASLEELLHGRAEAVVVASSTDTHAEVALASARAGKAMYLEKPIDLDFGKAIRTARELRTMAVPVMIGFNRRFDSVYRGLRQDIRSGCLGRVQLIQMTSRGPNEAPSREYIEHSGGIYRDKAIHFFDLMRYLSGQEAVEISVMGASLTDPFIGDLGDDDTCVIQLRLDDGSLCQIDNNRRAVYGFDERVEILASRGLREVGRAHALASSADEGGTFGSAFPRGFMHRFEQAFAEAIDGFARLVLDGERDVPTVEDGIAAQVVAEAATLSARERRTVQIPALLRDLERSAHGDPAG